MSATTTIQTLLDHTGLPPIRTLSTRPGIKSVHRVIVYAMDNSLYHSVATMGCAAHQNPIMVEVVYEGLFAHRPLCHPISQQAYDGFVSALHRAGFDELDDQPTPKQHRDEVCWWVEQATGHLYRRVRLWPQQPMAPYSAIVNAIDAYIPPAIREIRR